MGNTFKTALLLTALTLLLMFIGRIFGGANGMLIALIIAAVLNFISYFYSDKIALAMYRAQPMTREELPRAYNIVERLTQKVGLPMPKIYVIPTDSPNAFATGRNPQHASVAVTQGILNLLNDEERWALVDYVKTFDTRFANARDLKPMPLPDAPKSRSQNRGKEVYAKMQCAKCHGDDGRGVGPSSNSMVDAKERHVNARDFTQPGSFRTGWTEHEIIRTLETGMNGVPMPSYSSTMSKQEEYDLVAYVMSLSKHGSGNQKRQLAKSMEGIAGPGRVIKLREHAWKYEPSEIRVKRGEVVKIEFSATDNGLGAGHGFALDGLDQSVFINGAMVGAPLAVTFKVDTPGRYNFYCATQCSTTDLHPRMHGVLVVE